MSKPRLTIRIGATRDEVIIDGHTFDRSPLNKHQKRTMARMITDALFPKKGKGRRK